MLNPGKYDKVILFYRKTVDNSGNRAPTERWTKFKAKRARAWKVSTIEKSNDALRSTTTEGLWTAQMRFDDSITYDMVWQCGTSIINVKEITPNEDQTEMMVKGFETNYSVEKINSYNSGGSSS